MMSKKFLLLLPVFFLMLSCEDNSPDEQDATLALPHSKDLPEQELSEADKAKINNAKGKTVELLTFLKFQNLMNANDKDKLYIYNFWATWCKPCIEEMPYFEALQKAYPNKIEVIFVSLDDPKLLKTNVIPFVREREIISEVILVENFGDKQIEAISNEWDGAIPATLIINEVKGINDFRQQEFTFGELKALVSPYLL
jgi:thiol-disulfide isomerase/thioredoxin